MNKKILFSLAIIAISILAVLLILPKWSLYKSGQLTTINKNEASFYILKETNLEQLASELKKNGIIDDTESFIAVGEYKDLSAKKIALGKYIIAPNTKIKDLLNGFKINSKGNGNGEVEVEVTFNACRGFQQLNQMSKKVSEYSNIPQFFINSSGINLSKSA